MMSRPRPLFALALLLHSFLPNCTWAAAPLFHLDFGPGGIASAPPYDAQRGYGLEPKVAEDSSNVRFSVRLPEGNYRVSLLLGDRRIASRCTVKAEARRLMIEELAIPAGQTRERRFIVNVRTPQLTPPPANAPGGSSVRLKAREAGSPTWDDRLTLEFLGPQARVASLTIEQANVPTMYLTGDSTVTDQVYEPAASWGQMLPRFFDSSIAIANHAESGETLKSFLTELRLDKVLSTLRPGDWVLIQFGHNDEKTQWPQTYVEAGTTYRAYLRVYIAEVRRRGAIPVLVTPPERRNFDGRGRITNSHGDYPEAVREVAREESVAVIDLHEMSRSFYEALGTERAVLAFNDGGRDHTHHDNYGAYELARMVVTGIRAANPKLIGPLASHLASDVPAFDPRHPDAPEQFRLLASDARDSARPDGS